MTKVQIQIINDAMHYDLLLNDWEIDFINSLADKNDDYQLSDKQSHIINKIGGKVAVG